MRCGKEPINPAPHQNSISSSMIPSIALREIGNLRIKQFALPLINPEAHSLFREIKANNATISTTFDPLNPQNRQAHHYTPPSPPKSRPPLDSSSTSHPSTPSLSSSPNQPPQHLPPPLYPHLPPPCPHLPKDSEHSIISLLPPDPIRPSPYPIPQKRFPCPEV